MKRTRFKLRWIVCLFVTSVAMLPVMLFGAEETGDKPEDAVTSGKYSKEQLTQMLAPIALYPDLLLAQILGASTKPLDLVEASQFMAEDANKNLKGDDLEKVVKTKSWDENVKALCQFRSTLSKMAEKIDETKKLGEAYLDQHKDVMSTVQELRAKAVEAGNLKSGEKLKVETKDKEIVIVSTNPEVIYVPTYNPMYVYGPWWYPAPPVYWYAPRPGPGVGFAVGVTVGVIWGHNHRHRHYRYHGHHHGRNTNVNVNVNVNRNVNKNVNVSSNRNKNTNLNVNSNRNKNTNVNVNENRNKNANRAATGNDISKVSTKNTSKIQSTEFSGINTPDGGRAARSRGKQSQSVSSGSSRRSGGRRSGGGRSGGGRRRR